MTRFDNPKLERRHMNAAPPRSRAAPRYDADGALYYMAEAQSYVMARRIGSFPVVLRRREWDALSRVPVAEAPAP